jgi:hypothetical protein
MGRFFSLELSNSDKSVVVIKLNFKDTIHAIVGDKGFQNARWKIDADTLLSQTSY